MSVEERLFALAQQCRQQGGDGFLLNASQFAPRLNSQAPDLHAEIRALAAAFAMGAAARIAAAPNPDAEASAIASQIAVAERLSMASVTPALAVARRIGPLGGAAPSAPTPSGWAGDSVAVGTPAAPAAPAYTPPQAPAGYAPQAPGYTPPPQPAAAQNMQDKAKAWSKNPAVIVAGVAIAGFLLYQNFGGGAQQQPPIDNQGPRFDQQQPPPNNNQPPPNNNQQPPVNNNAGGDGFPPLQQAGAGAPLLQVRQHSSGAPGFGFTLQTQRGPAPAIVLLPQGSWQAGPVGLMIAMPGDTTGQNVGAGGQGQFQLVQSNGHPVRLAQIQMQQDNIGAGNMCLIFRGAQNQQDVSLSGADFCVMDASCNQPIGCGKMQ